MWNVFLGYLFGGGLYALLDYALTSEGHLGYASFFDWIFRLLLLLVCFFRVFLIHPQKVTLLTPRLAAAADLLPPWSSNTFCSKAFMLSSIFIVSPFKTSTGKVACC